MFSRLPRIEAIFARSGGGGVEGSGGVELVEPQACCDRSM